MGHDASKVLMGSTLSSVKEVDNRAGTIAAGLAVHLKSDDTISLASADGALLGISMGGPLVTGQARTAIARKGLKVPLHLTADFTPTKGAQVAISNTTGKGITYSGSGDAYVNAVYESGLLTGILEDGSEIPVALISFPGGL